MAGAPQKSGKGFFLTMIDPPEGMVLRRLLTIGEQERGGHDEQALSFAAPGRNNAPGVRAAPEFMSTRYSLFPSFRKTDKHVHPHLKT